jgi:hypothetical protein
VLPPDRVLNRLVVQLSRLSENDAAAILASLDSDVRRQVEILLDELRTGGDLSPPLPAPPACDITRLSPWLVERLSLPAKLTPQAHSCLLDCAARLFPMPPPKRMSPRDKAHRPFLNLAFLFGTGMGDG